jgi:uncharacterized protein with HEPN domain
VIRSTRPRLYDIDQNIAVILDIAKRRTHTHFQNDVVLRYTILHAMMVIAEAVKHLPPTITVHYPNIPWNKIVGVGVMIKHEYHRIDSEIIRDVVTVHLQPLHTVVKEMLTTADMSAV